MYAMYLRKSRLDLDAEAKGDLYTLERHQTQLLDLAKKQNLVIGKIYKEVVTGESIDARPEVQKLLDDVQKGIWEGVFVMEVERLARGDTIDQGIVARAFKQSGTKIITPIKTFDPSNEFDEEYFEFGLFMSRREYKIITRRIQRGRIQSAKEGLFLGSVPPFGYDKIKIPNDRGYTLTPNPTEAEAVKFIFSQYNSGIGMTIIANELDKKGVKTRTGKLWSKASIGDILKNPVYTGKIRWSYENETKDYATGKKTRKKNDNYILVDGKHSALISDEVFESAQKMRKNNTHSGTQVSTPLQNPLAGVIHCKKCGSLMTRLGENNKTRYPALKCSNRYCKNVSAPLKLVEEQLLKSLNLWINELELNIDNEYSAISKSDVTQKSIDNLVKEIETVTAQISKAYDFLEQGVYSIEIFTQRSEALAKKKKDAEAKLTELLETASKNIDIKDIKERVIPRIRKALNTYATLDNATDKNNILKNIVKHSTYQKNVANTKYKGNTINFELEVFPFPLPDIGKNNSL